MRQEDPVSQEPAKRAGRLSKPRREKQPLDFVPGLVVVTMPRAVSLECRS